MMNERWKELAKQATNDIMGVDVLDKRKFAELIVKECMTVTKDYTCNQGWDYSAPVALARHFGVDR
jgi:hypothetical protein